MSLSCSKCLTRIPIDLTTGRVPAWCPRCGADRKKFTIQAETALGVLHEASVARAAAPTADAPLTGTGSTADLSAAADALVAEGPLALQASSHAGIAPGPLALKSPALPPSSILDHIHTEDLKALAGPPRRTAKPGVIMLIIAVICLGGSFSLGSVSYAKLANYARTQGQVVDFESRLTTRGTSVHAVVAYEVQGKTYKFRDSESRGWFTPTYNVGDTVEVLYPLDQPGDGSINAFANLWLGPIVCAIPGVGLLLLWMCVKRGIGVAKPEPHPDFALLMHKYR